MRFSLLFFGVILLAGCQLVAPISDFNQPIACTQEGKVCLDGTVVGRTGADCEFAPCPETGDSATAAVTEFQPLAAHAIAGVASVFTFSSEIPVDWQAEAVPAIAAINIYNPQAAGASNFEKSQIFIRYFSGNTFLTLSTVTIHSEVGTTVAGRPAIRYDIEKKSGVSDFPSQPSWRNERHRVTDVRVSDSNPSIFYVIAKRPELNQEIFDQFLEKLVVDTPATTVLVEPIAEFRQRITKKPFGIYITPETSPVQPDSFTGYHTAVDVEYTERAGAVPVYAIADGAVVVARWAAGYGGVVAIRHQINGQPILGVYGHLDPNSLVAAGSAVVAGQQIGILGQGNTNETDGARKHLHFGLYKNSDDNILGYVQDANRLNNWIDPPTLF